MPNDGAVALEGEPPEVESLDSGEQSSISDLSVGEEYFRVHDFHHWHVEYRPAAVQQRVEAWRRRGRRPHISPDTENLSGTENANIRMMVGYFLFERPRSSRSSTPSPPQMRVISVSQPEGASGSSQGWDWQTPVPCTCVW